MDMENPTQEDIMQLTKDDIILFGYPVNSYVNAFDKHLGNNPDILAYTPNHHKDLNSAGYRSDEFVKDHTGSHVLFSGCSVTFGVGLEKEETWSWNVYRAISESEKLSGYFNLSVPGSSIALSIIKIFKYIRDFGNPKTIFLNLPNSERFLTVVKNNDGDVEVAASYLQIVDGKPLVAVSDNSLFFIRAMNFELYQMLELYCLEAGIRLISFSWEDQTQPDRSNVRTSTILNEFSTFYNMQNYITYDKYLYQYMLKNLKDTSNLDSDSPLLIARDGNHPGIIENFRFADIALKIYNNSSYRWINE